jgi:hypothetical protein
VTFREWLGKKTGYAEENAHLRSENISCRFLLSGHEKKIRELESDLTNLKRANEKLELEAKRIRSQKAVDSEKNVRAPYLYSSPEKANLDATPLPPYLNPAWNSTRIEK